MIFIPLSLFVLFLWAGVVLNLYLHRKGLVRIVEDSGYVGTLLIILSFVYSLRKKKILSAGAPKIYLNTHEILAWLGALMILVHGGIRLRSSLANLAAFSMTVVVASGLVGKFLLAKSRRKLEFKKSEMRNRGMKEGKIDEQLFWDAAAVDAMNRWRAVHLPLTVVFGTLAAFHILTMMIFRSR